MDTDPKISLRSPIDLAAAIPYLFGFHPVDSVVVLGLRAATVVFQARVDLPEPGDVVPHARRLATIVARQRVTRALVTGYGTEEAVAASLRTIRTELLRRRIDVPEVLRIADGRYFSYTCREPSCCDPAGTPFDPTVTAVAATATVAGLTAAGSREEIRDRIEPVRGAAAVAATRAAALRADMRLCALLASPDGRPDREVLVGAGTAAVDAAILSWSSGGGLDDDQVAWLGLLLVNTAVRDHAWERAGRDHALHADLWTEVVRRVEPDLAAAPATLLAYAAWRDGGGAMVSMALERALRADPAYPMAHYLLTAVEQGMSPEEYARLAAEDDSPPPASTRPRARRFTRRAPARRLA